eukprot:gene315-biopygen284
MEGEKRERLEGGNLGKEERGAETSEERRLGEMKLNEKGETLLEQRLGIEEDGGSRGKEEEKCGKGEENDVRLGGFEGVACRGEFLAAYTWRGIGRYEMKVPVFF